MNKKLTLFTIAVFAIYIARAQPAVDTVSQLKEVEVKAYFNSQPVLGLPASVSVVSKAQLQEQQSYSLLPSLNSVPGVRMEERSPGSYRLSIRGSLLRSPFGIRNIKIYMDDFPLTDAGGNTYLSSLDAGGIGEIELLKGPEASIFGANTGGVVLLGTSTAKKDSALFNAEVTGGSYGLFYQKASLLKSWNKADLNLSQAYQRSDGYRENSSLKRYYFHAVPRWSYSEKGKLRALLVYSDMNYHTPGGLTEGQEAENPRMARPSAGDMPGAVSQKAGVKNKTFFAGILHAMVFSERLRNVTAFTGSHTDFENPFITNYEIRNENSAGVRTYFELKNQPQAEITWSWQAGFEAQQTKSEISNFGNRGGVADTLQAADRITASQQFFFTHFSAHIATGLILEAAASINSYSYKYGSLNNQASETATRRFNKELMPRIALSYTLNNNFAWRASVSRGYSPPGTAEVRASDNIVNTALEAETGWNYETGVRISLLNNMIYFDGVVFNYHLKDAIVRRLNEGGNEYFINAGGTRQTGIESQLLTWLIPARKRGLLRSVQLRNSYTYSSFFFKEYRNAGNDYSGNRLTGVPRNVLVTSLNLDFPYRISLYSQYNYTSSIPLNDAGTDYAESYHLVQLKAAWSTPPHPKSRFSVYAGVDNLLNQNYSLGNDLNAFGGRYFNPAPERNFFAGIRADF